MTKYTDPELRERLKKQIMKSDKGGRPGQWSARKSQMLVQAYEKHGGGYRGKKDARSKSLEKWRDEDWQTKEGSGHADTGETMKRYLPEKAWELLTPEQKRATDAKKKRGKGQYVPNVPAARAARSYVSRHDPTLLRKEQLGRLHKNELVAIARDYDVHGRSKMNKDALAGKLADLFSEANTGMNKNTLQQKARQYGIKASQKKDDLIHDIINAVQEA